MFRKRRHTKFLTEAWLNIYKTSAMFRHWHTIQDSKRICQIVNRHVNEIARII
jgi:replicative superfamily II helicase